MYYLSDGEKKYFFSQLNAMSNADKITLARSVGQDMNSCSQKTKLTFLSCLPGVLLDAYSKGRAAEEAQNLFFTAGLYCKTADMPNWHLKQEAEGEMQPVNRTKIEMEIAKTLTGSTYAAKSAEQKIQDVLDRKSVV